jgi:hypothetical protein
MGMNLAGLGIIYNNFSSLNQQYFQLLAVPGSLTLVIVDGDIQNPSTYTIDKSVLMFDAPLAAGRWVFVISGQGGTFVPQSYVDDNLATKANTASVNAAFNNKADKAGVDFGGPITVQEPTEAMNPVTKQMFDSLPEIASPEFVEAAVENMVTQGTFNTALENLIPLEEKGNADGVTENGPEGTIKMYQIPSAVFYNKVDLEISGELVDGDTASGFRERFDGAIDTLLVDLGEAPEGSALRLNILKNGTPVYTNPVNYIDVPASSTTLVHDFATPPTFSASDVLGIRVEAVGSSTAGSDISARLEVTYLPD